jgi:hypothetical protein
MWRRGPSAFTAWSCTTVHNSLKRRFHLNNISKFSSHPIESTASPVYTSYAVQGNDRCLLWELHEHKNTLCGKGEVLVVNRGVKYCAALGTRCVIPICNSKSRGMQFWSSNQQSFAVIFWRIVRCREIPTNLSFVYFLMWIQTSRLQWSRSLSLVLSGSLEHCDCGFESKFQHGYMYTVFVLYVGGGLAVVLSSIQGVLPAVRFIFQKLFMNWNNPEVVIRKGEDIRPL